MTRILAIDPGLDAVGLALFDLDLYDNRTDVESIGRALVGVTTIRTSTDETLVRRLSAIVERMRLATLDLPIWRVYVEEPAKSGSYRRNRDVGAERMAEPMSKLYMALGAIIVSGAAFGSEVMLVPAPRQRKEQRQILATSIFRCSPAAKTHRDALPSGDALDAVWLGGQQLSGDIAFDRRRLGQGAGAARG